MPQQARSSGRESISRPAFVVDQARCSEVTQALREHARRHVGDLGGEVAVSQPVVSQFPDHSKRPPPTENVEQLKQPSIGGQRLISSAMRSFRQLGSPGRLDPSSRQNASGSAQPVSHGWSNALISDARWATIEMHLN
jgi:hypothetical protein